jgi:hypothetical protein
MNNLSKSQEQSLDEKLSEFTDQVLSSDKNEATVQDMVEQGELAELQKTVLRMKAATQTTRTNNAASIRIRTRLMKELEQVKQLERQAPKHFFGNWSWQRMALSGGLIVLFIFGFFTLLTPSTATLVGAADGLQTWSPLFILVGMVVIVLLLWQNRNH